MVGFFFPLISWTIKNGCFVLLLSQSDLWSEGKRRFLSLKDKREKWWLTRILRCSRRAGDTKKLLREHFIASAEDFSTTVICIHFKSAWERLAMPWCYMPLQLVGASKVHIPQPVITRAGKHAAHPLSCSLQERLAGQIPQSPSQRVVITRVFRWLPRAFKWYLSDSWSVSYVVRKEVLHSRQLTKSLTTMLSQKWPWESTIATSFKMALPIASYHCFTPKLFFFEV